MAQPGDNIAGDVDEEVTLLSAQNPITPTVTLPTSILCNCWAYVKSVYPSLPGTGKILNNISAHGSVAVFYYPKTGLHHYAVVLYETDTHYVIEETNYHKCKKGMREVRKDDPTLIGFFPMS